MTHLHWKIIPTKLHLKSEADFGSLGTSFQTEKELMVRLDNALIFVNAKHTYLELYKAHAESTGEGHSPIHPEKSRQDIIVNNSKLSRSTTAQLILELDGDFYPSTRPTSSSSSAHWEQPDDWKSN